MATPRMSPRFSLSYPPIAGYPSVDDDTIFTVDPPIPFELIALRIDALAPEDDAWVLVSTLKSTFKDPIDRPVITNVLEQISSSPALRASGKLAQICFFIVYKFLKAFLNLT